MPSVNINPETFSRLMKVAIERDSTPDAEAERLLEEHLPTAVLSNEEWRKEFRRLREEIQAAIPSDATEEELQADIVAAIREVREERRARGR